MIELTPRDLLAIEIGRLVLRAHTAEQEVAVLRARLAEIDAERAAEEQRRAARRRPRDT